MCEFNNKIKNILFSNINEDDKISKVAEETDKEFVLDYIDNNELGVSLEELGLTEEDLLNAIKYEIDESDNINFSVNMNFFITSFFFNQCFID